MAETTRDLASSGGRRRRCANGRNVPSPVAVQVLKADHLDPLDEYIASAELPGGDSETRNGQFVSAMYTLLKWKVVNGKNYR